MRLNWNWNYGRVVAAWLVGVLLVTVSATGWAEETPEEAPSVTVTNKPALEVNVQRNVTGSYLPHRYAFVTAGLTKHTFLVPESYRVDLSDPSRIKLTSPDYTCMIVLGLRNDVPAGSKMEPATLRRQVLADYADAVINLEHTVNAVGQTSPAVDFTCKPSEGLTRKARTTFIPVAGGLMEFTLTASPERFEAGLAELNLVLLTFRGTSDGKFDYVIGSKYP